METKIEVEYRAGYLIPTERSSMFDIKRDSALMASGSHFFCQACSVAVPIEKQSSDLRYCQDCYLIITGEKE